MTTTYTQLANTQDTNIDVDLAFECDCQCTEIRARRIRGNHVQHVRQCLDCGFSVGSAVKQEGVVPEFDEGLKDRVIAARLLAREDARTKEKQSFDEWYGAYLQSPQWKHLRTKVFERDRYLCQGCLSEPATVVHHATYDHVGVEFAFELVSLCHTCHDRCHAEI